jgi:hypothetical protein
MATYKKEEVKRIFYGDAQSFFFDSSGASLPRHPTRPCGGFGAGPTPTLHLPRRTACRPLALPLSHTAGYNCRRLEKRSQALQACNLTRNIQADGAPMVHHPWGVKPPGVVFHHRTPELCLGKRTGTLQQDVSFSARFGLRFGAVAFSSFSGRSTSPSHLWGTLRRGP